jgi:DNA-binding NarL/FixJ family response regulator
MSAKLRLHPSAADRAAPAENAANDGTDSVLSCIRQVLAGAEQICSDAADIEDARFIAENIADTCRRALVNGRATMPLPPKTHPGKGNLTFVNPLAGSPDRARKTAARERLDNLSARELEIFTHLAEGRSAAEIAVVLSRSSKTINNHRTRILQKLGLKNATELVRLAVHSGLVSV